MHTTHLSTVSCRISGPVYLGGGWVATYPPGHTRPQGWVPTPGHIHQQTYPTPSHTHTPGHTHSPILDLVPEIPTLHRKDMGLETPTHPLWTDRHLWKHYPNTPPPSSNKAPHSGFETQRRRHQKSKTGVSVAPPKFKKKQKNITLTQLRWRVVINQYNLTYELYLFESWQIRGHREQGGLTGFMFLYHY